MARSSDPKNLALWQGRFRRFLDSGLAVARFCADEDVSESSFYYWQKKLRPQALLGPKALLRPAHAEGRDRPTRAEDHGRPTRAKDRGDSAKGCGVFRPVTVVPAACGVVVRLPGGVQIEVEANPLDAIRAVVAETVRPGTERVDHDRVAERNVSSDNQVIRKSSSDSQADRKASSDNPVIHKASSGNRAIRQRGGAASC